MSNKTPKDTNILRKAMNDRGLFRALDETPCRGPFHPEKDRGHHTQIVNTRYALSADNAKRSYGLTDRDIRTMYASVVCHDLGCIECTQYNKSKDSYTAYGHEKISHEMMADLKDPIESFGADYDTARWLVLNHMKAHFYVSGALKKEVKRQALENHPAFNMLMWLEKCDDMLLDFDGEVHC
ncbi:hypothetical protein H8D85_01440 [bacterium]|nr:hypothetical protein [bacterium]